MPDRPLTILQLTHQGGPAGSTQSIFGLSQHLARCGHRVVVGCREDTLLARLAREAALPVAPLAFTGIGALARSLAGVIARERVDVVNAHATRDRRALAWLRWRGALPQAFVVTRRTMPLTSPLELVAVGLAADRTIAVSEAVARALRRRLHPGGRLRVVPNGIALERVDAAVPPADLAAARAAPVDVAGRPVVPVAPRPTPPRGRGRSRDCSATPASRGGWHAPAGSSCGASSRSNARPRAPKPSTARRSPVVTISQRHGCSHAGLDRRPHAQRGAADRRVRSRARVGGRGDRGGRRVRGRHG